MAPSSSSKNKKQAKASGPRSLMRKQTKHHSRSNVDDVQQQDVTPSVVGGEVPVGNDDHGDGVTFLSSMMSVGDQLAMVRAFLRSEEYNKSIDEGHKMCLRERLRFEMERAKLSIAASEQYRQMGMMEEARSFMTRDYKQYINKAETTMTEIEELEASIIVQNNNPRSQDLLESIWEAHFVVPQQELAANAASPTDVESVALSSSSQ
eukprot:CAMPEP_0194036362 /NCGR_PEP_ID=MMETSP0009_2-20130614/8703_1 /TAXON_ID=210454 /ORGANISM="Grammatophora oceanica, Strain CCMP 410" /LENGTH=206 /DNA_ID=CAMNT_0038678073 /DNA_START=1 /DNA_END=621 /DNA_ORIENTATION=-